MSAVALVELRSVGKSFCARGRAVQALSGVDLEVHAGEFVAITGASGSGKSTLLHIVGALESPSSGRYRFDDHDISHFRDDARASFRRKRVGFVFQAFHLLPQLDLVENVALPFLYSGHDGGEGRERAKQALVSVGLSNRLHHRPSEISGGEMQRAAIARAVVTGPDLIVADEPTGNLDPETGAAILRLLERLNERGTTLMMATHDESLASRAPVRVRMRDGRVA